MLKLLIGVCELGIVKMWYPTFVTSKNNSKGTPDKIRKL